MNLDEKTVLAEALRLPAKARAVIATRLLDSLDEDEGDDAAEVERAWTAEIARRQHELSSGAVRALSGEEADHLIASDDPADDQ